MDAAEDVGVAWVHDRGRRLPDLVVPPALIQPGRGVGHELAALAGPLVAGALHRQRVETAREEVGPLPAGGALPRLQRLPLAHLARVGLPELLEGFGSGRCASCSTTPVVTGTGRVGSGAFFFRWDHDGIGHGMSHRLIGPPPGMGPFPPTLSLLLALAFDLFFRAVVVQEVVDHVAAFHAFPEPGRDHLLGPLGGTNRLTVEAHEAQIGEQAAHDGIGDEPIGVIPGAVADGPVLDEFPDRADLEDLRVVPEVVIELRPGHASIRTDRKTIAPPSSGVHRALTGQGSAL